MWLKLLLVPLLLFGFSAMHTLGHAEGAGHGGHLAAASDTGDGHSADPQPAGGHNAAPWAEYAAQEDLPDLDPTDMCPTLSGFTAVNPGAATTVVTPWPQAPPGWTPQVRTFDPSGVQAENKPSLSSLQILRV
ncbi:hypothetical protein IDM40_02405 [Nocardiopsis sp. HNM0947]|uniref:Uncharacterized protein n=1 Tax=Nocardiopsis coralli TaxID=2772213 RepID=A0ABR9P153_9ACTN|nr:hypothetical protein [Nocardiopsis coralli]